jgi:hypothetical protein
VNSILEQSTGLEHAPYTSSAQANTTSPEVISPYFVAQEVACAGDDAKSSAAQQRTTHRAAKRVSYCFPGLAIVRHATHNPKHRTNWAGKEERNTCCMRLQSNKTEGRGGDSPVQYVSVNGAKFSAFSRGKARKNCEA